MAADGGENGWEILVTGHSLGGALATLCSPDLQLLMPEAKVLPSISLPMREQERRSLIRHLACETSFVYR
jgi:putative lipase involved disintegration of autophagic bodies